MSDHTTTEFTVTDWAQSSKTGPSPVIPARLGITIDAETGEGRYAVVYVDLADADPALPHDVRERALNAPWGMADYDVSNAGAAWWNTTADQHTPNRGVR